MPYTQKQRAAAFAELDARKTGGETGMFKGMSVDKLKDYAASPLEKKGPPDKFGKSKPSHPPVSSGFGGFGTKPKSKKFTASDQAAALRGAK